MKIPHFMNALLVIPTAMIVQDQIKMNATNAQILQHPDIYIYHNALLNALSDHYVMKILQIMNAHLVIQTAMIVQDLIKINAFNAQIYRHPDIYIFHNA